jgi:hypothetical protein
MTYFLLWKSLIAIKRSSIEMAMGRAGLISSELLTLGEYLPAAALAAFGLGAAARSADARNSGEGDH